MLALDWKAQLSKASLSARTRADTGIVTARAVACFMVILIHIAGWDFYQFADQWWPTNVYDSFARFAVPVFFMISGALLLAKEDQLGDFLRKRALRVLPPLLFWSAVYLQYYKMLGQGRSHGGWIATILTGPVEAHLWYLYAIVGLYAFVPMLRKIYLGSSEQEKRYFLLLWFAVAVLYPSVMKYLGKPPAFVDVYHFGNFTGYAGYLFLGAYLHERKQGSLKPASAWCWASIFVAASLGTMLLTWWQSVRAGTANDSFYDYLSPLVVIAAVAAFKLLLGMKFTGGSVTGTALNAVAANSLGIYCVHLIVLERAATWHWLLGGSHWWTLPANAAFALLVSMAVVAPMKRMPLLRHVV